MFKLAMVFGVFDGLHPGHKHFLSQAVGKCERLILVLTLDQTSQDLKGRAPKQDYQQRAKKISEFNSAIKIIPGDSTPGQWSMISQYKPEMIFLGYDQQGIAKELKKLDVPFAFLEAHNPEQYKSSLMDL